jgi:hypothetical protein
MDDPLLVSELLNHVNLHRAYSSLRTLGLQSTLVVATSLEEPRVMSKILRQL